jgi:serine O-acetyltransferase
MGWLSDYRLDVQRHVARHHVSPLYAMATSQQLWALLQYRIARAIYRTTSHGRARNILLKTLAIWRKWIEMLTGICIPYSADIGPGLYIPHPGMIIINGDAVMGRNCTLSHGVTIGSSGRGEKSGTPTIGDSVFIGPNAVVIGRILVGDYARIGPNSLVNTDVPAHGTVVGVPAIVLGDRRRSTKDNG